MNPEKKLHAIITQTITNLKLTFVLSGVVLPPEDVAMPSGVLPAFVEQQQSLAELIGIPAEFQPFAFGKIVDDDNALFGKILQLSSKDSLVPMTCYLVDAIKMSARLAQNNKVDLQKILEPNKEDPFFLSVVLDELCGQNLQAETLEPATTPEMKNPGY